MLIGTVKYFKNNEHGGCGIIISERGDSIYFMWCDGGMVTVIDGIRSITPGTIRRVPEPNDRLVYEIKNFGWKQTKAAPWCFEDDWLKASSLVRTRRRSQPKLKRASAHAR